MPLNKETKPYMIKKKQYIVSYLIAHEKYI